MEPVPQQPQNYGVEQPTPAHVSAPLPKDPIFPHSDPAVQPPPYAAERPRDPYVPQQPMSATNQPVTPLHRLRDIECWIDCPFCHQRARTRVDKVDTAMTFVIGLLLCLICICLACIPCIAHWCADIDHYCTNCNKRVAHIPNGGEVQVLSEQGPHTVPSRYAAGPDIEANAGVNTVKVA